MRRSSIRLAAAVVFTAVCVVAPTAVATVIDRDTGFDANDVPPNGHIDPDIASSTRKLTVDDGGRRLSIVVRFYERHGGWPLWIRLDARLGPRVDHIVSTFGDSCFVWPKGHKRDGVQVRAEAHGRRFVCRMPARLVSPTKSIRWKVRTKVPDGSRRDSTFVIDYAPSDRGWYG